jgi:hypothetical protein
MAEAHFEITLRDIEPLVAHHLLALVALSSFSPPAWSAELTVDDTIDALAQLMDQTVDHFSNLAETDDINADYYRRIVVAADGLRKAIHC